MSYGSEVVRICFLDTNCSQGQQPAHQHRPSVVRLIEAALLHSFQMVLFFPPLIRDTEIICKFDGLPDLDESVSSYRTGDINYPVCLDPRV